MERGTSSHRLILHAAHKDDDDDDGDGAEINSQTGVSPGTKAVRARCEKERVGERGGDAVVGGRQVGTVTQTIDLETGHCHAVYNREREGG